MSVYVVRNSVEISKISKAFKQKSNEDLMGKKSMITNQMKDEFKLNMKSEVLKTISDMDKSRDFITEMDFPKTQPYSKTISLLKSLQWIQCPIEKLNYVYDCLKFDLVQEVDNFYEDVDKKIVDIQRQLLAETPKYKNKKFFEMDKSIVRTQKKERVIDIDNLTSISIYILQEMGYPYVVCDYNLILDFTSSNILISSRCIYLNVLKGASEYLLEIAKQNEEILQQLTTVMEE